MAIQRQLVQYSITYFIAHITSRYWLIIEHDFIDIARCETVIYFLLPIYKTQSHFHIKRYFSSHIEHTCSEQTYLSYRPMSKQQYELGQQQSYADDELHFNSSNNLGFYSVQDEDGINWLNDNGYQQSDNLPVSYHHHQQNIHYNNRDQITQQQPSVSPYGKDSEAPPIYCYNIPQAYNEKPSGAKNGDFDSQFGSEQNQIKEYLQRRTERQDESQMYEESQLNDDEYDEIEQIPIALNLSLVQKSGLSKRINELAMKKKNQNENEDNDIISVSTNDQNVNIEDDNGQTGLARKKRKTITVEILQQLKGIFKEYKQTANKNHRGKLSFRIIAQKVQISIAEVKCLYQEYQKDSQFTQRIDKISDKLSNQLNHYPMASNNSLTNKRIKFIQVLIRQKGALTTHEIVEEMSHMDNLHNVDKSGQKMAITRRLVQHLMNIANIKPKQVPYAARNINTFDCIHNRFRYAVKYLELTDDKASDICFLGQFSFVNNLSLSSCPIMKRDSFVDIRYIRGEPKTKIPDGKLKSDIKAQTGTGNPDDRYGRNLQYLIVLSLHGVIYYELYYNIFQQMKFGKTLQNIGRAMRTRNPNQKKFLLLETSFFHKKTELEKFQRKSNVKVAFLPANTPMLNPTEYLFNEVKQLVKSKSYKIKRPYASVLTETLETLKQKNMQSYYTCIRPYLELALKQQPFK